MAIIKIQPYIVDETQNFTFNNVTATGNILSLNANLGNLVTANYFSGSGANLTSISGANVSGQVGNALVAGTVYTASQPNITSVGVLSSVSVSGNANVGNIGSTDGVFTGNITANNLTTTNKVTAGNGLQVSTGTLTVTNGNLDVTGNINVTGNLNYSNVTDLVVGDPLIYIGANNTGDLYDLGIVGSYNNGTYYHTGLARNATTDTWTFFDGVVAEPTTVIDWANATYPTVKLGNLTATGTLSAAGNANVGNLGTAGLISTAGNITGANLIGSYANGNSNVNIPAANGNVNISSAGNANIVVVTGTGANITGTLSVSGNANIGNLGTAGLITVTGNVTAGNLVTGGVISSTGNANVGNLGTTGVFATTLSATGNANVGNLGATGVVATTLGGSLTTAAQPNVTSVGTLTALTVGPNSSVTLSGTSGYVKANSIYGNDGTAAIYPYYNNVAGAAGVRTDLTVGTSGTGNLVANTGKAIFGAASNVTITGGTNGYVLSTDGTGNLSWVAQSGGGGASISNGTSNVNIATSGGNITASVGGNANIVTVTGTGANISGTLSVSGQTNLGAVGNVKISGGTANYVLSTDGTGNLSWVAQSGGGSANISISDEGNVLTSSLSSMNFVGTGVTATAVGGAVTVTIPTTTGPASITVDTFTGNGVQTAFTLSTAPLSANYTTVNIDGVDQLKSAYSVSGTTLTMTSAPANGAKIDVTTISAISTAQPSFTTRNYTGNGVQTNFTVTNGVTATGVLTMLNGIVQVPTTDYTISGTSLIFTSAPASNQAIQIRELGTVVASSLTAAGSNTQVLFNDSNVANASANFTFNKATNTLNATNITANGAPVATTGKAIAMAIVFGF